jgi:hypothetical protein
MDRPKNKSAKTFFELGTGGRNESVYDELAAWAVEDYHGSAWALEHGDILSKLLRFHGNGVELSSRIREVLLNTPDDSSFGPFA